MSVFWLWGCAHTGPSPSNSNLEGGDPSQTQETAENGEALPEPHPWFVGPNQQSGAEPVIVNGVALKVTTFDLPFKVNTAVEKWVEYFTGRGRKHFELYLARSEYFIPYIRPILRERGLPEDLVFLAMIESGFNNHARSRAKAVGPWQFIQWTGKRYGLRIDWWVDERRDIRRSTEAAADYLTDLYRIFKSWELASSAYNAGEMKILRAIRRYGAADYWNLVRHRFLRPETRNYYPKLLAAALLTKNRTLFGFPESYRDAAELALAQNDPVDSTDPKVADDETPMPLPENVPQTKETYSLEEVESTLEAYAKDSPRAIAAKHIQMVGVKNGENNSGPTPVPTPKVGKTGKLVAEQLEYFEVTSPADLLMVAKAAGLSYKLVKHLNPEVLRWCTPPGNASYLVKLPISVKDRFLVTYNHPAFPKEIDFRKHKVRAGESVRQVASRFGFGVDPVRDLNRLGKYQEPRAGDTLLLPIPEDRSRSISSLDLRDPPSRKRPGKRAQRQRKSSFFNKVSLEERRSAQASASSAIQNSATR